MSEFYDAKIEQVETRRGMEVRNREVIPNLKAQRDELLARVQKIDTFLQLLEQNPGFEKLLNLSRELI